MRKTFASLRLLHRWQSYVYAGDWRVSRHMQMGSPRQLDRARGYGETSSEVSRFRNARARADEHTKQIVEAKPAPARKSGAC